MKRYDMGKIRNVALIAHGRAGKTSLAEAVLFAAGAIKRKGHVDQGTTVCDYDDEEVKRSISLSASLAPVEWKKCKVNVIDTPGYFDFAGDVVGSLRVADGAVSVLCATSGIEVGTELTWEYADGYHLPRLIFVNKMDRENADFDAVVAALQDRYGSKVVPVHHPLGSGETFTGIVDLLTGKAYQNINGEVQEKEIPPEFKGQVEANREGMVEAIAATDDELTLKYLEDEELTEEELLQGLALGTKEGSIVPVLCGSALQQVGVDQLLDMCVACLPAPSECEPVTATDADGAPIEISPSDDKGPVALVFKTMADQYVGKLNLFRVYAGTVQSDSTLYNPAKEKEERVGQLTLLRGKEQIPVDVVGPGDIGAVSRLQETTTSDTLCDKSQPVRLDPISFPQPKFTLALRPEGQGDEEKVGVGLSRLVEEDPTFQVEKNSEAAQLLVSGLGEMHIEVMCAKLKQKFGVSVDLEAPRVPYRETIRKPVEAEYRHKKQSGGHGQYGHVVIQIEPLDHGTGFEFVDKIFGGAVPRQYIPAVEHGIQESMAEGILAGYPVVDVRVTLKDGSYHSVDSSEMAFKIAGSSAFKQGFLEANPVLLEPIMNLTVVVPDAYMGDVMGDLNKKRGRVLGMEPAGNKQTIRTQAPMAELFRYAIDLRSITQGRGDFTIEFDHYEEVPVNLAEKVIASSKAMVS